MQSNDKRFKQTKYHFYEQQAQFKYNFHEEIIILNQQIKKAVISCQQNSDRIFVQKILDSINAKIRGIKAITQQQLLFLHQKLHSINFDNYPPYQQQYLRKFYNSIENEDGSNIYYMSQFSKIEQEKIIPYYQKKLQALNVMLVQTQSRVREIAQQAQSSSLLYKKQQQNMNKSKRFKRRVQAKIINTHIVLQQSIENKLVENLKLLFKAKSNQQKLLAQQSYFEKIWQKNYVKEDDIEQQLLITCLMKSKQKNLSLRQAKQAYKHKLLRRAYSETDLQTYLGPNFIQYEPIQIQRKYKMHPHRLLFIKKVLEKTKISIQKNNSKLQIQNVLLKDAIEKAKQDKILKALRNAQTTSETTIYMSPRNRKYFFQKQEDFNYQKSLVLLQLQSQKLNENYQESLDTLKHNKEKIGKDDSKIFAIRRSHHNSVNQYFFRRNNKSLTHLQTVPQILSPKKPIPNYITQLFKQKPIRSMSTMGNENSGGNNQYI